MNKLIMKSLESERTINKSEKVKNNIFSSRS